MTTIANLTGVLVVEPPNNTNRQSLFVNLGRSNGSGGTLEWEAWTNYGGIVVLTGTPTTGSTVGATINGHPVTVAQTTGQQIADVAAALAAAINADGTDSAIVRATSDGPNVRIVALLPSSPGAYSLVATQTGGAMNAVASVSALVLNGWFTGNGAVSVTVAV